MNDDSNFSLRNIVTNHGKSIASLLLNIGENKQLQRKYLSFIQELECLRLENSSDGPILIRREINAFEEQDYVALSYTWGNSEQESPVKGKYKFQTRGYKPQLFPSPVRDSVFDRVFSFMRAKGLSMLWIDRHCVKQKTCKTNVICAHERCEDKKRAIETMDLLQAIWEHKVWQLFDWSRGSWPMVPGGSEIGEATDEASVRPAYQLLQEEIIPVSVSQSKDFGSEQGEEEAYSDDEDEDTDSVFSYDEVDRDNSEFGDNQAEANESHHANYPMAHLRGKPHGLVKKEIDKVKLWAEALDLAESDEEILALPPIPDTSQPIEALGKPKSGGFRCTFTTHCRTVSANSRRRNEHLWKVHGVELDPKPGPRKAGAAEADAGLTYWRGGVFYQQLFAKGPRSEYFEVARGHDLESLDAEQVRAELAVQQATQAFQAKSKEARKKEMEVIEEMGDLAAPNSWLRRLGSTAHLKDFSDKKQFLKGLISLKYDLKVDDPKDDSELLHIHAAVRRLIRKASGVARPGAVSWNVLFEVNRKELHKERSTPFHFRFKRQTRKRYIAVCLQFFAYAVRAISCENVADRPPFKLTEAQTAAFDVMMDYAAELIDIKAEIEPLPTSSRINELHELLENAALAFYISVLDHFTKTTEYDSILVSFLTVLSIRDDKTWENYANFTPKLSAIMAISRVFLVKHTVDKRALYIKQRVEQGQTRQEAEEKSPGHFEIMSDMTRRFLVGGAEGWDTTPTQFIIRLRNYGKAASGQQAMPGSVSWDNEDAIYKGIRINVLGVQSMLQAASRRAETLLYKHLLFCEEYKDQSTIELGLPQVLWDDLIDNAADASIGHSFVDNLFQQIPESSGWAFRKIWTNGALQKAWIQADAEAEFKLLEKKAWHYGNHVEEFLESLIGEVDEGYGSDSDSELEQDSIWDAQACHGSLTAGLVYGRLITEGCFETNERRVNFRFISEEWHRLLGFPVCRQRIWRNPDARAKTKNAVATL
ncbi:hypothetical protein FoTM2_013672 [Fusarium oxysporum f. sp. vasinfectum]|nr:hypothetical protein FoTM2_013672 [Fusarium oxysporum f. sp. vasinfectum]